MVWDYEEGLKEIAVASVENWNATKDGECVICGSAECGYYDLCKNCYDKPIPDYNAFHVGQLFSILHGANLSDLEYKMSKAYSDGYPEPAVQTYRDYCFNFGTPGRLYYNSRKEKADRSNDPTPGCPAYLLKLYG